MSSGTWLGLSICALLMMHSVVDVIHVAGYLVRNPSEGIDIAYAVCIYNDVLYVVGSTSYHMFIEAISVSNSSRLLSWVSNWVGELYDCVVVNSSLFVVGTRREGEAGRWFIGVFNEKLGLVTWRESYYGIAALSASYSSGYLYVAGYGATVVEGYRDVFWIIEKVEVGNISSSIHTISNPSRGSDIASAVGVNPATGEVWVAGTDGDRRTWRIEVYDEYLRLIASRNLDIPNYPYSIEFDLAGNAYIAGTSHVVKIGKGLEIVARAEVGGTKAVIYGENHLILVSQHSNRFGFQSHYIYVLDDDLDVVSALCATCDKNYSVYADRGRIAIANGRLYIAGYGVDSISRYGGDSFIVLYSIQIPEGLPIVRKVEGGSKSLDTVVFLVVIFCISMLIVALAIRSARVRGKIAKSRKKKEK